jgi:hypothetical protein
VLNTDEAIGSAEDMAEDDVLGLWGDDSDHPKAAAYKIFCG